MDIYKLYYKFASLKYFECMYTIVCFTTLFLPIFGDDYTKNSNCYKNVKLTTHKNLKMELKELCPYLILD